MKLLAYPRPNLEKPIEMSDLTSMAEELEVARPDDFVDERTELLNPLRSSSGATATAQPTLGA